jgi:hypothetical protein
LKSSAGLLAKFAVNGDAERAPAKLLSERLLRRVDGLEWPKGSAQVGIGRTEERREEVGSEAGIGFAAPPDVPVDSIRGVSDARERGDGGAALNQLTERLK